MLRASDAFPQLPGTARTAMERRPYQWRRDEVIAPYHAARSVIAPYSHARVSSAAWG